MLRADTYEVSLWCAMIYIYVCACVLAGVCVCVYVCVTGGGTVVSCDIQALALEKCQALLSRFYFLSFPPHPTPPPPTSIFFND